MENKNNFSILWRGLRMKILKSTPEILYTITYTTRRRVFLIIGNWIIVFWG